MAVVVTYHISGDVCTWASHTTDLVVPSLIPVACTDAKQIDQDRGQFLAVCKNQGGNYKGDSGQYDPVSSTILGG